MTLITNAALVDTRETARRIKDWLSSKGFETRAFSGGDAYTVKARKSGAFRAFIGADRALEVGVRHFGGETQVDIRQGSWKTNAISNVAWIAVTGGANLVISGWSLVAQKELEQFVRSLLDELSGTREVDLSRPVHVTAPMAAQQAVAGPALAAMDSGMARAGKSTADGGRSDYRDQWKSLGFDAVQWIAAILLVLGGGGALLQGLWKGALVVLLAALLTVPQVRRLICNRTGVAISGNRALAYGIGVVALVLVGTSLQKQQEADKVAAAQAAKVADAVRASERKRAASMEEFQRDKIAILAAAQRAYESGDSDAALAGLAKFASVRDPDLVRLRTVVKLEVLRRELAAGPAEERRVAISAEIAQLDPSDSAAVAQVQADKEAGARKVALDGAPGGSLSDDQCRDQGDNVAKVFFANFRKAVEVGMTASEMMESGCRKIAAGQRAECVELCKDGFRYRSKQATRN